MNLALATPAAANTETVRAGINERSFFASMRHLFAGSFSMVGELLQNGRRAGATKICVEFDPEQSTMAVVDDGHGIRDFNALIQLCESSWDEQTMLSDRPFGMGLFSLLFAAREITYRSCGRRLTVTLQDVIDKRALEVVPDADAPAVGTRIELVDLSAALLQKQWVVTPVHVDLAKLAEYALYNALRERACGFPIPVFINGFEMHRPYEQAVLKGEITSIGFVSIPSIHVHPQHGIGALYGSGRMKLLLQGLPIGSCSHGTPEAIVHLDTTAFTARMPDRSALYDHDEACKRINSTIVQLAKDHLVRQKAILTGKQFVLRHWKDCRHYDLLHLLNDIPWIPREAVLAVHTVTDTGDEVHANFMRGIRQDDGGDGAPDIPMDALSTFRDDNDDYHSDWRDRAIEHWDSVVSGLRGESLANVVVTGLRSAATTPSEGHAQHIAIVRTRQRRGHDGALYAPEYSVVDAQRDGFWEEVARQLEAFGGNEPLGAHLKAAFYAVVKPGEQEQQS